jgi:hypothetical protein
MLTEFNEIFTKFIVGNPDIYLFYIAQLNNARSETHTNDRRTLCTF